MRSAVSRPHLLFLLTALVVGCARSTGPTTPAASEAPRPVPRASGAAVSVLVPPITSFGALRVDDAVYIVGGYSGTPHAYDRTGQHDALRRLSLGTGELTTVGRLPYGVQSPTLLAHDGALYVHGGMRAENGPGEPASLVSEKRVVRFDAQHRAEVVGEMPEGRSSHAAAILGDHVYVIGGWTIEGASDGRFARDTLVLDARDGHSLVRRLPQPFTLRALAAVTAGDRIVIIGGMTENGTSSDTFLLDANGTFTDGPDFPTNAFGVAAVAHEGQVYASAADGRVFRLDVANARWDEVARLGFPRFFHQLVSSDDGLLAVGGIAGMSPDARVAVIERVRLGEDATNEPLVVEIPAFGEARNRQGMAVVGNDLLLFGGNDAMDQHAFAPENFERAVFRVHLGSLRVDTLPDLPFTAQTFTTVLSAEGTPIAIGGFGPTEGGVASRTDVLVLGEDDRFVPAAFALPNPRTQIAAHFVDGAIWVLGGLDYDDRRPQAEQFHHFDDILVAPFPGGPFAPAGVALPGTRRAFASAAHEGRIYVVGGMREQFQPVTDCGYVDTRAKTWHPITCPTTARFSASLVPVAGKLVMVGGTVAGSEDPDAARAIEVYDPQTDTWRVLAQRLPFSSVHVRGFAYGERLLVASTHAEDRALRLAFIDVR